MKNNYYFSILILSLLLLSAFGIKQTFAASDLAKIQKGKILLQVEANGEAWYVNPADEKRYFMGRPTDAYNLMKKMGVGITSKDLDKISIAVVNETGIDQDGDGLSDVFEDAVGTNKMKSDSDSDGYNDKIEISGGFNAVGSGNINIDKNFSKLQNGRILIAVERHGEAWYINPIDGKRYFMGRPTDAFNLMRNFGLGISNANLEKIQEGNNSNLSDIAGIISKHQTDVKEIISAYDKEEFKLYESTVKKYFTASSQEDANDKVSEFFTTFAFSGLKKINRLNLNNEWQFAYDNNYDVMPYKKINATTITIGLGIESVIPYQIKLEDGVWKIELSFSKEYFAESEKIADIEVEAVGSEVELYLASKIKTELQAYKKLNNSYPKSIYELITSYPIIADYMDIIYYSYSDNYKLCHFGIDINEGDSSLNKDSDFNSLEAGYVDGFNGEDPIYDITLE